MTPVWYARPRIVLPLLGAIVLVTALLAREPVSGRGGDPRLSAYSAQPLGARLLYELAGRLGWNTRRTRANTLPASSSTVLAVLDPTETVSAAEAHAMLEHVRGGGGLLLALGTRTTALSDSLRITADSTSGVVDSRVADDESCPSTGVFRRNGLWFGGAQLIPVAGKGLDTPQSDTLLLVRTTSRRLGRGFRPAIVALPYGRGRIVIAADPDVFRNDALRECRYGIDLPVVRALEYLRGGSGAPRTTLAFDEYHQTRPLRAGITGAVQRYLGSTPSGHAVLQLALAGIILLLALAPRLLVPREERRVERRSPLEHVDALARAYQEVQASRTATQRLVRGLRRRVERGASTMRTSDSDARFLDRVAESTPSLAKDVDVVRAALGNTIGAAQFHAVGVAIANIEAALVATRHDTSTRS